jgi:pimeloyl-ACP methyl ester carboxylesterase
MSLAGWIILVVVVLVCLAAFGLVIFTARTAQQVERQMPPRGHFIEIDGAHIHYVDEGSGPPLLMVHGLAGQMHNFTHSLLERLKHDYRVVILDRPGNGHSIRPPDTSAALGAQARMLVRFCEALGLERPLVVGHSLGGAIALALALDYPDRISGLALLAPVSVRPKHVPPPFDGLDISSSLLRHIVAWTLAAPMSIRNTAFALSTLFGPQPAAPDFATRGGAMLSLLPRNFVGASTDLAAAHVDLADMPARYKDLRLPVGILYGTGDRVLDRAAHGDALAAVLPNAELELIEGGGHMILIASADRSAAFIARMAQRAAAADATLAPTAQG